MASSGTIDKVLAAWLTMRLKWVVNSQSVANNTSNITVYVQLITGNGNLDIGTRDVELTINGTKYTGTTTSLSINANTTKNLYSKTVNVAHNSDGSKTVAIACTLTFDATISGTEWGDKTLSGNAKLNAIARASTFTRSGTATMGSAQTIAITRASDDFTHRLYYTWGGTKTLIALGVGTSYTWRPPITMAQKIPNATSGACTLTCETYNGSTLVGTKTLSFTLSIPSSLVPTISDFTLAEAVSGLAAQFGGFINTKSKITYAVTAAGAQGSTISSYSVLIAGQSFAKQTATTAAISVSGAEEAGTEYTATVTVTDSRGRTASKSVPYIVYAYSPPTFHSISACRCTADGTIDDNGEYILFSIDAAISPVNNKNTTAWNISYKLESASEYTTIENVTEADNYITNNTAVIENIVFSTDYSYNIKVTATDYFGSVSFILVIPTAQPVFDVLANGKGFAVGKVAEIDELFDVGWKLRFFGGILPLELPAGADFDNYKTPNIYTNGGEVNSYLNCPIASGSFKLEVSSCGNAGQVKQELTYCSKTAPRVYERYYYQNTWGEWICISNFGNKILWSGNLYMTAGHTVTLSEPISKQPNGIILVFSPWENSAAQNNNFQHFFISKAFVASHAAAGSTFALHRYNFSTVAAKYLYISDTDIKGNDANGSTGAGASGVSYNNAAWVLRYVMSA